MIPTEAQCLEIMKKEKAPINVIRHCKAVAKFAVKIAEKLVKKGIKVDIPLVMAAALLHDIARHRPGDHEIEGINIAKKLGFDKKLVDVIRTHGLFHVFEPGFQPNTVEQKIVFYADKRANGNKEVSVEKRFEYLRKRYGDDERRKKEYEFVKKIEKELMD